MFKMYAAEVNFSILFRICELVAVDSLFQPFRIYLALY